LVNHFFPRTEKKTRFAARISDIATEARVSGVQVADFADKHENGRYFVWGVDITDFKRYFPKHEWKKLPSPRILT